jgi:hypothetical protein
MGDIVLAGATSGTTTLTPTAVSGTTTLTLPATTGTVALTSLAPTFSAYCSSTQSISAATNTKIQYQTEEWDTNNNFDNTTNYRFTPTVAGYYQISGSINFQSAPTSISLLSIYKNGSEFKRCFQTNASIYGINGSAVVYCNGSTDYIELYCYQSGGGAINTSVGNALTYFQAAMIRSA